MASKCRRNLLHINKLEEFKKWCHDMDIPTRPGKGDWQVLQVSTKFFGWRIIHKRLDMKEHYTVDERLIPLVKKFIDQQHMKGNETESTHREGE